MARRTNASATALEHGYTGMQPATSATQCARTPPATPGPVLNDQAPKHRRQIRTAVATRTLPLLPRTPPPPSGGAPQVFAIRLARWAILSRHQRLRFCVRTGLASRDDQELRSSRAAQTWGRPCREACVLGWTARTLPWCSSRHPVWRSAQRLRYACDERDSEPVNDAHGPPWP